MVRKLALFRAMGKRTYVHCTAGINRASSPSSGTHLVEGTYDQALAIVRVEAPDEPLRCPGRSRASVCSRGAGGRVPVHAGGARGNSIEEGGDWISATWSASIGVIQSIFNRG